MARDAALGDLILRSCLLRRWALIGMGAGFKIVGSRHSPDTRRLLAPRNRLPHRWIDLEEDPSSEALLRQLGVEPPRNPRRHLPRGRRPAQPLEHRPGPGRGADAIVVENNQTGERRQLPARAFFVFIGADPHVDWLAAQVELDEDGFVLTGTGAGDGNGNGYAVGLETILPGVFAAGDVRSGSTKRVAAAVGECAMAVRLVHQRLAGDGSPPSEARTADERPSTAS